MRQVFLSSSPSVYCKRANMGWFDQRNQWNPQNTADREHAHQSKINYIRWKCSLILLWFFKALILVAFESTRHHCIETVRKPRKHIRVRKRKSVGILQCTTPLQCTPLIKFDEITYKYFVLVPSMAKKWIMIMKYMLFRKKTNKLWNYWDLVIGTDIESKAEYDYLS